MTDAERKRQLRRLWNEVVTDNLNMSEDWCIEQVLNIYRTTYQDYALKSDVIDALETAGDVHR